MNLHEEALKKIQGFFCNATTNEDGIIDVAESVRVYFEVESHQIKVSVFSDSGEKYQTTLSKGAHIITERDVDRAAKIALIHIGYMVE